MTDFNTLSNELASAVLEAGLLKELLSALGCKVMDERGDLTFRGPCPVHGGEGPNFVVKTDGHTLPIRWACHSRRCHEHPPLKNSLLGLVRGALTGDPDGPASMSDAIQFVRQFLAQHGARPTATWVCRAPQPIQKASAWPREKVQQRLEIPSRYFVDRGFDPAVLDRLDVGYSHREGRTIVPIYDDAGQVCVGYASRSVKPFCTLCQRCHNRADGCRRGETRWKFPPKFSKGDWLYNYHLARQSPAPFVLLVEGAPDVFRAAEAEVPAVTCFGTAVSVPQTRKLAALGKRVVVAFDNDQAGVKAAWPVASRLQRAGVKAVVHQPPMRFKDVGEMPAPEVSAWLAPILANPLTIGSRGGPQR